MTYWFRSSLMKGEGPGHPFRGNQYVTEFGVAQGPEAHGAMVDGKFVPDVAKIVRKMVLNAHDRRNGDKLVLIDVAKLDAEYAQSTDFYVGPGGTGAAIGSRYKGFQEFLAQGIPIEAPDIYLEPMHSGVRVAFGNGRHRWAVLRDLGAKSIKVALGADSLKVAKKLGWVVKGPPPTPSAA